MELIVFFKIAFSGDFFFWLCSLVQRWHHFLILSLSGYTPNVSNSPQCVTFCSQTYPVCSGFNNVELFVFLGTIFQLIWKWWWFPKETIHIHACHMTYMNAWIRSFSVCVYVMSVLSTDSEDFIHSFTLK